MIAFAKPASRTQTAVDWQAKFLELLPSIRRQARMAFRHEPPERRQDLVAEVLANSWVAYVRLMERGLDNIVYATPLAQYAVRQVRAGRRVGCRSNVKDVSSEYAQRSKGFVVESLDRYDKKREQWREILVEDRKAGPAEIASCRIDVAEWLQSLPSRLQRIAETLANGEPTKTAARRFGLSPGRISQLRRELKKSWESFHGEETAALHTA